jgi:hypothetical protein
MKPILSKDSANQEHYKMQGFVIFVFIVNATSADEKRENPGAMHRDLSVSRRGYRYFPPE